MFLLTLAMTTAMRMMMIQQLVVAVATGQAMEILARRRRGLKVKMAADSDSAITFGKVGEITTEIHQEVDSETSVACLEA